MKVLEDNSNKSFVLQDHSLSETPEGDFNKLMAENWDAPVIVTTSVRFFEGLFSNRSTSCRRLHNIARSVILFDEAQTMPRNLVLPTLATLAFLNSRYKTSIVFSTATQPAYEEVSDKASLYFSGGWKPQEIVPSELKLFERARRVKVRWPQNIHSGMSWDELSQKMLEELQVCAIVNLKKHAETLHNIISSYDPQSTFHLSTSMCPNHRFDTLIKVKKKLLDKKHVDLFLPNV